MVSKEGMDYFTRTEVLQNNNRMDDCKLIEYVIVLQREGIAFQ